MAVSPRFSVLLSSLRVLLSARRLPLYLAVLGMLLTLPGLGVGLQLDDFVLHLKLLGVDFGQPLPAARPQLSALGRAFAYVDGVPSHTHQLIDWGLLPWWTSLGLKVEFWRPLSAFTHYLDFFLWPDMPWLMHLQNVLWFGALLAVVARFFRAIEGATEIAGLAALLYAVDDAHGLPVGWISLRNALLATFFGILCIRSHLRWRREGEASAAWGACAWLLLSLLSAEAGIGTAAYLVAYELFLAEDSPRKRLLGLVPAVGTIVAWRVVHNLLGYNAVGSGVYLDPQQDPLAFGRALVVRAPLLLLAQWAGPPADLYGLAPPLAVAAWWVAGVGFLVFLGLLLAPSVGASREGKFWAAGMLLSLLPVCATYPMDRLLLFPGLGAMALVARFLKGAWEPAAWCPARRPWNRWTRPMALFLVAVHGLVAPLALPLQTYSLALIWRDFEPSIASLPSEPEVRQQTFVIVNAPVVFLPCYLQTVRLLRGIPRPRRLRWLAPGRVPLELTRTDDRTLLLSARGGFPADWSWELVRDKAHPLGVGDGIALEGVTIEVTALGGGGMVAEVLFRFDGPLESPSLRWFQWKDGRYAPLVLPRVGETVTLPAVRWPL